MIDLRALWDFVNPKVTRKRFEALVALTPKRICFSRTHPNALKKAPSGPIGYFNVPFSETISELFPWEIFKNKFGYSRTIKSEAEFDAIAKWIAANREVVFVRSLLGSCIAACEHQGENGRSETGELEYRAKWHNDGESVSRLADILTKLFRSLHNDTGIDAICAIPSSTAGKDSLPCKLAAALSHQLEIENVTGRLSWNGKKETIKDKEADEKWAILESVGLTVEGTLDGRKILIVDDMYQSGATVHYVASRLQEAGATGLHCMAVSKSRGDKDNV